MHRKKSQEFIRELMVLLSNDRFLQDLFGDGGILRMSSLVVEYLPTYLLDVYCIFHGE